jgi:hypothetical protein
MAEQQPVDNVKEHIDAALSEHSNDDTSVEATSQEQRERAYKWAEIKAIMDSYGPLLIGSRQDRESAQAVVLYFADKPSQTPNATPDETDEPHA